jgi:precorrin-4 methylase
MKKRLAIGALLSICLFMIIFFQAQGWSASAPAVVRITGLVKQPMSLTSEDLARYETVNVRLTEVTKDTQFHGVFNYRGVPLKTLLELASIEKEKKDFSKPVDMAIVIRNKAGKQIVLSWGEIMFRNPADTVLAFSATPIFPYRDCGHCHKPDVYKERQDQLTRQVGFPKLVLANDFYTDRSLEDVVHIEVVDLNPKLTVNRKSSKLFSPSMTITGSGKNLLTIKDLSSYPHMDIMTKPVGEGMGYHGLRKYTGVSLVNLLEKAGAKMDTETAFIVSSVDGYRSLLSYGELFLAPGGERIMIADSLDGKPIDKDGKFLLMPPDDLAADRDVKAVDKIDVINLKRDPKVFIISIGCADTSLLTLEAINYFAKADVFVCTDDQKTRFAKYIGERPVLFDYFKYLMPQPVYGKELAKLTPEEKEKLLKEKIVEAARIIKDALMQGKTVAMLEYGDPSIYGSLKTLGTTFREENIDYKFIPGISAFNAANALIGKEMACKGSIVLSSYWGLQGNEDTLRAIAKSGDTLVIFMGLKEMQKLIPLLQKHYPDSTPVNIAYNVGSADNNLLYKTTLDKAASVAEKVDEKWLGMIYVGPCVK